MYYEGHYISFWPRVLLAFYDASEYASRQLWTFSKESTTITTTKNFWSCPWSLFSIGPRVSEFQAKFRFIFLAYGTFSVL